jgi:hypothetical protein
MSINFPSDSAENTLSAALLQFFSHFDVRQVRLMTRKARALHPQHFERNHKLEVFAV